MSELALVDHVIHGRTSAVPESLSHVFNPATGEISAHLPLGGALVVDLAVGAALKAFPDWAATPPHVRTRVFFRFHELIERDMDRLAGVVTDGVPDLFRELALQQLRYAAGELDHLKPADQFAHGVGEYLAVLSAAISR